MGRNAQRLVVVASGDWNPSVAPGSGKDSYREPIVGAGDFFIFSRRWQTARGGAFGHSAYKRRTFLRRFLPLEEGESPHQRGGGRLPTAQECRERYHDSPASHALDTSRRGGERGSWDPRTKTIYGASGPCVGRRVPFSL